MVKQGSHPVFRYNSALLPKSQLEFCRHLLKILMSPKLALISSVGLDFFLLFPRCAHAGVLDDGKKLFRDYGILAKNLVELGSVALVVDPVPIARRKIVSLAKVGRAIVKLCR